MWVFTSTGFVSLVEDWDDTSKVFVRGRRIEDIDNFFGAEGHSVLHTPNNDYKYRVSIEKSKLADILAQKAREIDYSNFKNSMEDPDLIRFAHEVWCSGVRNLDEEYKYPTKATDWK